MTQHLSKTVHSCLQELLHRDSAQATPVVQSVSLFFWQNLAGWTRQIALVQRPFTIALAGPSGSGKSFICQALTEQLSKVSAVSSFTQDNYYRDFELDFPHLPLNRFYDEIDFDDPAHIRFRRLAQDLADIRGRFMGDTLKIPQLRFGTPTRKPSIIEQAIELPVMPFMVTEGIHAFHDPAVLPHYDLKIYVDVDEETRRKRWLARNQRENRGTTDNMWNTTVACLEQYILPTRSLADLVINNNAVKEQVHLFITELVFGMATLQVHEQRDIA